MTDETGDPLLEAEIDGLYQLHPAEFVEARNALAARRKAAGDAAGTVRVKALKRPSVPAWVVNRLHGTARADLDAFLAAARLLQSAQAQRVSGDELRDAIRARRDAQVVLLKRAESVMGEGGRAVNPAARQRVSGTLEALAVAAPGSSEAAAGRLTVELDPPGFEALAAGAALPYRVPLRPAPAAPPANEPPPEPAPAEDPRIAALAEAEQRLDRARRLAREAAGAQSVAQTRAEGAEAELQEATRRLERAKERAAVTAADAAAARAEAERLARERDVAQEARDALAQALKAASRG